MRLLRYMCTKCQAMCTDCWVAVTKHPSSPAKAPQSNQHSEVTQKDSKANPNTIKQPKATQLKQSKAITQCNPIKAK